MLKGQQSKNEVFKTPRKEEYNEFIHHWSTYQECVLWWVPSKYEEKAPWSHLGVSVMFDFPGQACILHQVGIRWNTAWIKGSVPGSYQDAWKQQVRKAISILVWKMRFHRITEPKSGLIRKEPQEVICFNLIFPMFHTTVTYGLAYNSDAGR